MKSSCDHSSARLFEEVVQSKRSCCYPLECTLTPSIIKISYFSADAPRRRSTGMSHKYIGKGEKHARTIIQRWYYSITSPKTTYFHL
jgi:hypothetical protein